MDFRTAVRTGFAKYLTFEGRASRSEYWYFVLFTLVCVLAGAFIDAEILRSELSPVSLLAYLALVIPSLAVAVRRLHDLDSSGWFVLLSFVPVVNVALLVWFCMRGTVGPNRFGTDPLTQDQ